MKGNVKVPMKAYRGSRSITPLIFNLKSLLWINFRRGAGSSVANKPWRCATNPTVRLSETFPSLHPPLYYLFPTDTHVNVVQVVSYCSDPLLLITRHGTFSAAVAVRNLRAERRTWHALHFHQAQRQHLKERNLLNQNSAQQDRHCTYKRNTHARSRNHCCRGKAIVLNIISVCL
jgi:hypothetical protein